MSLGITMLASAVRFDDSQTKLGATTVQAAMLILLARIAALESRNAALVAAMTMDFRKSGNSGGIPGV